MWRWETQIMDIEFKCKTNKHIASPYIANSNKIYHTKTSGLWWCVNTIIWSELWSIKVVGSDSPHLAPIPDYGITARRMLCCDSIYIYIYVSMKRSYRETLDGMWLLQELSSAINLCTDLIQWTTGGLLLTVRNYRDGKKKHLFF